MSSDNNNNIQPAAVDAELKQSIEMLNQTANQLKFACQTLTKAMAVQTQQFSRMYEKSQQKENLQNQQCAQQPYRHPYQQQPPHQQQSLKPYQSIPIKQVMARPQVSRAAEDWTFR